MLLQPNKLKMSERYAELLVEKLLKAVKAGFPPLSNDNLETLKREFATWSLATYEIYGEYRLRPVQIMDILEEFIELPSDDELFASVDLSEIAITVGEDGKLGFRNATVKILAR
jgi:hypothetical protein